MHTAELENLPFVSRSVVDLALLQAISQLDQDCTDDASFGSRVRGVIMAHRAVASSPAVDSVTERLMDFAADSVAAAAPAPNVVAPESNGAHAAPPKKGKKGKKKKAARQTKKASSKKTPASKKAATKTKAAPKKGKKKAAARQGQNGAAAPAKSKSKSKTPRTKTKAAKTTKAAASPGNKAYTTEERQELREIVFDKVKRLIDNEADTSLTAIINSLYGWRGLPQWLQDRNLTQPGLMAVVRRELETLVEEKKLTSARVGDSAHPTKGKRLVFSLA